MGPNVNYKSVDGMTPLHQAALAGSAEFCKKLIDAKADPNVPATAQLVTPLEQVIQLIEFEEERDDRLNDTALAYRPNLKPYKEVKKILEDAGGVCAKAFEPEPVIKPDGSISGGAKSPLRSYDFGDDGFYTVAAHLRTGKYDVLTYEDDKLVETEFDPKTGHWTGMPGTA